MNNQERGRMNPLLGMLGPLMPTLKSNNRDKFWAKNRRELDRIGWSGKYIFSDSEEEEEILDSLIEQERDEDYHNTSCGGFWNHVHFSDDGDVSESEREYGKEDDRDNDSSGSSQALDKSETSSYQSEQRTEDCHHSTSSEYDWDDVYFPESELTDWDYDADNEEDDWFDADQVLIEWAAAFLLVVGVWCVITVVVYL